MFKKGYLNKNKTLNFCWNDSRNSFNKEAVSKDDKKPENRAIRKLIIKIEQHSGIKKEPILNFKLFDNFISGHSVRDGRRLSSN